MYLSSLLLYSWCCWIPNSTTGNNTIFIPTMTEIPAAFSFQIKVPDKEDMFKLASYHINLNIYGSSTIMLYLQSTLSIKQVHFTMRGMNNGDLVEREIPLIMFCFALYQRSIFKNYFNVFYSILSDGYIHLI